MNQEASQQTENPATKSGVNRRNFLQVASLFLADSVMSGMSKRIPFGMAERRQNSQKPEQERKPDSMERIKTRIVNDILRQMTVLDFGQIGENGQILPMDETDLFNVLSGKKIDEQKLEEFREAVRSDPNHFYEKNPQEWIALQLIKGRENHGFKVVDYLKKHLANLATVAFTNLVNPNFVPIENEINQSEASIRLTESSKDIIERLKHEGQEVLVQYKGDVYAVVLPSSNAEALKTQAQVMSVSQQAGTIQVEALTHKLVSISEQITNSDIRSQLIRNFPEIPFNRMRFHVDLSPFDFENQEIEQSQIEFFSLEYKISNQINSGKIIVSADLKTIISGRDEFMHESENSDWEPIITQIVIEMQNGQKYISSVKQSSASVAVVVTGEESIESSEESEEWQTQEEIIQAEEEEKKVWKKLLEPIMIIKGAFHPENPHQIENSTLLVQLADANPATTFVFSLGNHGDQLPDKVNLPPNLYFVGQLRDTTKAEIAVPLNATSGSKAWWVRLSDHFNDNLNPQGSSFAAPLLSFALAAEKAGYQNLANMTSQQLVDGTSVNKLDLSNIATKITEIATQERSRIANWTRRKFLGMEKR